MNLFALSKVTHGRFYFDSILRAFYHVSLNITAAYRTRTRISNFITAINTNIIDTQ